MPSTIEAQFVVCGSHEIRHSAAGSCPLCSDDRWRGPNHTAPASPVSIVRVDQ